MKIAVIDNYDSFTFNLVQCFGQLGVEQRVFRNDEITAEQALALNPERVLLSPGPCSPREAGVTLDEAGVSQIPRKYWPQFSLTTAEDTELIEALARRLSRVDRAADPAHLKTTVSASGRRIVVRSNAHL